MKNQGFVYIFSNPAFACNVIKVGMTKGSPIERAAQLFTTGLPTPFKIEFVTYSDDCVKLERDFHRRFDHFRSNGNREFFVMDLKDAVTYLITQSNNIFRDFRVGPDHVYNAEILPIETSEPPTEDLSKEHAGACFDKMRESIRSAHVTSIKQRGAV